MISSRVGVGFSSNSAFADMIMPGVQKAALKGEIQSMKAAGNGWKRAVGFFQAFDVRKDLPRARRARTCSAHGRQIIDELGDRHAGLLLRTKLLCPFRFN
jgi:hypothetical protein